MWISPATIRIQKNAMLAIRHYHNKPRASPVTTGYKKGQTQSTNRKKEMRTEICETEPDR